MACVAKSEYLESVVEINGQWQDDFGRFTRGVSIGLYPEQNMTAGLGITCGIEARRIAGIRCAMFGDDQR